MRIAEGVMTGLRWLLRLGPPKKKVDPTETLHAAMDGSALSEDPLLASVGVSKDVEEDLKIFTEYGEHAHDEPSIIDSRAGKKMFTDEFWKKASHNAQVMRHMGIEIPKRAAGEIEVLKHQVGLLMDPGLNMRVRDRNEKEREEMRATAAELADKPGWTRDGWTQPAPKPKRRRTSKRKGKRGKKK
jgi:hypothetical protein